MGFTRTLSLLTLLLTSTSYAAEIPDFDSHFEIKGSTFDSSIRVLYREGTTLDVIADNLSDPAKLRSIAQDLVERVEKKPLPNGDYELWTTAVKVALGIKIRRTTVSHCTEKRYYSETESEWETNKNIKKPLVAWAQSCVLVKNKGDTKELFHSGGSRILCRQNQTAKGSAVSCEHRFYGRTKSINKIVYKRTGAQLAVGGHSRNIKDISTFSIYLQELNISPLEARSLFEKSSLATLAHKAFKMGREKVDSKLFKGKKVILDGSNHPYNVTAKYQ